jgi:uncharacterized membrane protein YkoI
MRKHLTLTVAFTLCAVILSAGVIGASASNGDSAKSGHPAALVDSVRTQAQNLADKLGIGDDEAQVAPGTLDDGKDLLSQAKISIDEAIAAAQSAQSGAVGEIDLEHFEGRLVFNVDIGDKDVKVDAGNGTVLSSNSDD